MENKKNEIREKIYNDLIASWKSNNYKGFTRISVGAGKSYMMIKIIQEHIKETNNAKILILVPTQVLRDKSFIDEVNKWWDKKEFNKHCQIRTYQKQMNLEDETFTLGLFDEADVMLSPRYSDGFNNNLFDKYLALSGTYTKEKKEKGYELFGNFLLDYPLSKAMEEGLVNKLKVNLVFNPLETKNLIQKKVGKWSEDTKYKWIQSKIDSARMSSYSLYRQLQENPNDQTIKKQWISALKSKQNWESGNHPNSRLNVLYTLASNSLHAKTMLDDINKNPNNKTLIFAKRTAILDDICGKDNTYYGKQTNEILDDFANKKISHLGVSKKIERGFNFDDLTHGIFHSYSSSESELTQQLGKNLPISF